MLDKYIALNRALRAINAAAHEADEVDHFDHDGFGVGVAIRLLNRSISDLDHLWPPGVNRAHLDDLIERVKETKSSSFSDIIDVILPQMEDVIDSYFKSQPSGEISNSILDLLHPRVTMSSYSHFRAGRYRDAILNALISVFDLIRERTGLDKDGAELVGETFSLQNPRLIFSDLDTESGKSEQKGFIQILQGAYLGIRNPNAHTLQSEVDQVSCAQYLVFASLLCRKVEECKSPW